jgi:hypothetical protein
MPLPTRAAAIVPLLLSKPDYCEGLRRKNGLNLEDSVLRCGIAQSKDRKTGRKRPDPCTSREIASSL